MIGLIRIYRQQIFETKFFFCMDSYLCRYYLLDELNGVRIQYVTIPLLISAPAISTQPRPSPHQKKENKTTKLRVTERATTTGTHHLEQETTREEST